MPEYNWSCLACEQGNDKENDICHVCGCPAESKLDEVEASKFLYNKGNSKCPSCGSFYSYTYSEDLYRYRKRGALFRILYINLSCDCKDELGPIEFEVPFFRKLYRKFKEENEDRWFFKI